MPEVLSESAVALTVPADKSMMLVIRLTTRACSRVRG